MRVFRTSVLRQLLPSKRPSPLVFRMATSISAGQPSHKTFQWTANVRASDSELSSQVAAAAKLLRANEVVGFPTETVYGLGGNALSDVAMEKIYAAKGRPSDNPLIVHVATVEQFRDLVEYVPPIAEQLIKAFWPGPLTIILKKKGPISSRVTAGLDTVAVRMPNHPVALALIREANLPIAAPSANLSGKPSPTTAAHVYADLNGRIAGVLDGGPTGVGLESTVVDCSCFPATAASDSGSASGAVLDEKQQQPVLMILRPGGVTLEQLVAVVGEGRVVTDPGLWGAHSNADPHAAAAAAAGAATTSAAVHEGASSTVATDGARISGISGTAAESKSEPEYRPRAPGMKYTHYAPRAPVHLVTGSDAFLQQTVDAARATPATGSGSSSGAQRVGVLTTEEKKGFFKADVVLACGRRADLASVAQHLYDCLRAFDETDVDVIFSEAFPETGMGQAVMNRLEKAAGNKWVRQSAV